MQIFASQVATLSAGQTRLASSRSARALSIGRPSVKGGPMALPVGALCAAALDERADRPRELRVSEQQVLLFIALDFTPPLLWLARRALGARWLNLDFSAPAFAFASALALARAQTKSGYWRLRPLARASSTGKQPTDAPLVPQNGRLH